MATERKTHGAIDRAQETTQASTERAARAAHEAAETIGEYGARARGEYGARAREQLRETGENLRQTTRAASERSRELMDQVSGYIVEHPMTAIGIAVAVGFALGAMVGRSSNDEA